MRRSRICIYRMPIWLVLNRSGKYLELPPDRMFIGYGDLLNGFVAFPVGFCRQTEGGGKTCRFLRSTKTPGHCCPFLWWGTEPMIGPRDSKLNLAEKRFRVVFSRDSGRFTTIVEVHSLFVRYWGFTRYTRILPVGFLRVAPDDWVLISDLVPVLYGSSDCSSIKGTPLLGTTDGDINE